MRHFGTSMVTVLLVLAVVSRASGATEGAAQEQELSLRVLVERCRPAVVLVLVQTDAGEVQGSGVIVDPSGKVLTCHHVVDDAKSAAVKMWNGGYFPAEGLLGFIPASDIALLRIRSQELPSAPIGDSSALAQGDKIFALGAPRGLEQTLSEGIVSGMRTVGDLPEGLRSQLLRNGWLKDQRLIQFSAPTSPGSSGGPVFNMRGEVVGIVSFLHTTADNVYFAVPADYALPHLPAETVLRFEEADQGILGISGTGAVPPALGLCPPESSALTVSVPREEQPVARLTEGEFVQPESVRVSYLDSGKALLPVEQTPEGGQFRAAAGGLVYFSQDDSGKRVRISYQYRLKRVAILAPVNESTYPELGQVVRERWQEKIASRGYEVLPEAEVDAAARAINLNPAALRTTGNERLASRKLKEVARELNAALVVFSAVAVETYPPQWQEIGILCVVSEGATGEIAYARTLSDIDDLTFKSNRRAREKMINHLTDRMMDEYLGQTE